jgi:hypothetical protein
MIILRTRQGEAYGPTLLGFEGKDEKGITARSAMV